MNAYSLRTSDLKGGTSPRPITMISAYMRACWNLFELFTFFIKKKAEKNVYFIPRAIRTVFLPGFAKPTRGVFQARGRQPEGLENPKGRFRKQRAKNVLLPVG